MTNGRDGLFIIYYLPFDWVRVWPVAGFLGLDREFLLSLGTYVWPFLLERVYDPLFSSVSHFMTAWRRCRCHRSIVSGLVTE